MDDCLFWWLIYFIPPIAAVTILAVLFLPKFYIARVRTLKEQTLDSIAYELRRSQFRVERIQDQLKIRIGSTSAVKIHVKTIDGATRIFYQADATPSGWSIIIILIMFMFYTSPIAIFVTLYLFFKTHNFVKSRIKTFISLEGKPSRVPRMEDTKVMLLNGLSEGYRLSTEAYEAEKTSYKDYQALVALGALIVWVILFCWLFVGKVYDLASPVLTAFILSTIGAIIFAVPLSLILRNRLKPRILEFKKWSNRLRDAVRLESECKPPHEGFASTFELLAEASKNVPVWLDVLTRRALIREPGTFLFIFIWSCYAIWLLILAMMSISYNNIIDSLILVFVGIGLTAGLYLYYERWKRKNREARARIFAVWDQRFKELHSRMERYIQDL